MITISIFKIILTSFLEDLFTSVKEYPDFKQYINAGDVLFIVIDNVCRAPDHGNDVSIHYLEIKGNTILQTHNS